jgi:hypothetical protein
MKKAVPAILVVAASLWVVSAARAEAPQGVSLYVWRLVNQARVQPLETILKAGIDEGAARAALGEDQWILDEGIPPVAWNRKLYQAALDHLHDMVHNLFYSHDSSDGRSFSERIAAAGYDASLDSEALGALAFPGFVEELEAARLIFQSWLRDELDPRARMQQRNIFNPDLTEVGVALAGTRLRLGEDLPRNVYVAVADYARPWLVRAFLLGNVMSDSEGSPSFTPEQGVAGAEVALRRLKEGLEAVSTTTLLGAFQFEVQGGDLLLEARGPDGIVLGSKEVFSPGINQLQDLRIEGFGSFGSGGGVPAPEPGYRGS